MRKVIIAMVLVLALIVAIAVPAFAAIHPIVESLECAAEDKDAADPANPPGQIGNPSTEEGGPNADHNHPFQNSNDNATSGEGHNHCENG